MTGITATEIASRCCRTIFPPLCGSKIAEKLGAMSMGTINKQFSIVFR